MQDPRNQNPFNALPPVVTAIAVVIMGIELMFLLGNAGLFGGRDAAGWRLAAIRDWAVIDPVWQWMWANLSFPPREAARWLAYPLIHQGFTHAAMVTVFVLALGNAVAPVYRGWRIGALFFGSVLAGGLAYVIVWNADAPLFGGYPGAYGLIGAFTYLTQRGLTRADPSRAFLLIGLLLAIQPVFGLLTGAGFSWLPLWTADLAGAGAGWGLAALMFPGTLDRIRDRLRQR